MAMRSTKEWMDGWMAGWMDGKRKECEVERRKKERREHSNNFCF
jgi:hypothetical protein